MRSSFILALTLIFVGLVPTPRAVAQTSAAATNTSKDDVRATLDSDVDSRRHPAQIVTASIHGKATLAGKPLPKSSYLVGHLVRITPKGGSPAQSRAGLVFDQVKLKDGTAIPVHAILRSVDTHYAEDGEEQMEKTTGGRMSAPSSNEGLAATNSSATDLDYGLGTGSASDSAAEVQLNDAGHHLHLNAGTLLVLSLEPR